MDSLIKIDSERWNPHFDRNNNIEIWFTQESSSFSLLLFSCCCCCWIFINFSIYIQIEWKEYWTKCHDLNKYMYIHIYNMHICYILLNINLVLSSNKILFKHISKCHLSFQWITWTILHSNWEKMNVKKKFMFICWIVPAHKGSQNVWCIEMNNNKNANSIFEQQHGKINNNANCKWSFSYNYV